VDDYLLIVNYTFFQPTDTQRLRNHHLLAATSFSWISRCPEREILTDQRRTSRTVLYPNYSVPLLAKLKLAECHGKETFSYIVSQQNCSKNCTLHIYREKKRDVITTTIVLTTSSLVMIGNQLVRETILHFTKQSKTKIKI
jgi:predicted nucleic acid-binding Zn ribbon protein